MELYPASSTTRSKFSVASRPIRNVGSPFPLSENSPFLSVDDPQVSELILRKDRIADARLTQKRRGFAEQRLQRQQELARRMCERETVENYIQTPFARARGNAMEFGFNVIDGAFFSF